MREREAQRNGRARGRGRREGGFTVIQMVITCAVVAVAMTFAIMGIASARTSMRVQSSARQFAAYVEKSRSDAVRRHGAASVEILSANATSYTVTMDFDLDGDTESRTIQLEEGVTFNSTSALLTFDWRGRLAGDGLSFTFVGPGGSYPVQLDVTGSGDVTIGEEKFLDSEVPAVTLNNGTISGTGDVNNDVALLPPGAFGGTTPPTTTPPTTPPTTTPPTTTPPTTTPPTTPPTTTPPTTTPPTTPPPTPPGNGNGNGNGHGNNPPSTPPTTPPPTTTPPSTTPPSGATCSLSASTTAVTINACNNGGNNCGSTSFTITMSNGASGATVSATTVPSHLQVTLTSTVGGVYTFKVTARNNTRTTNNVVFTGTSCGTKSVSVKTQ